GVARVVGAGEGVGRRRVGGAVGPDQGGDIATSGREREIVDGHQAAEAHAEVFDAQHGREIRGSSGAAWARTGHRRVVACDAHEWRSRASEACAPSLWGPRERNAWRALRNVEGSRVAISRRGLHTMISTI